jgi:hypothetical protein
LTSCLFAPGSAQVGVGRPSWLTTAGFSAISSVSLLAPRWHKLGAMDDTDGRKDLLAELRAETSLLLATFR